MAGRRILIWLATAPALLMLAAAAHAGGAPKQPAQPAKGPGGAGVAFRADLSNE